MFCPNCGKSDQTKKTYCRQCGTFLPDLSKTNADKIQTPEEQFRLSLVFNCLSAAAGISMAIALIVVFFGQDNTHPVIYAATSLFLVISAWQIVSFFNNWKLRKRFVRKDKDKEESIEDKVLMGKNTNELLPEADFDNIVPASVVENTTRNLTETIKRSTKSEQ